MSNKTMHWLSKKIKDVNERKASSIDPSRYPEETFELFSVPIFPTGAAEIIEGKDIGSTKQIVQHGDVLLCKINPRINRVWVVSKSKGYRQIASSEWIVVRSSMHDSRFLKYFFQEGTFRDLLCSDVSGVGGSLTRAKPKLVNEYEVVVTPLAEQKRIVEKLDDVLAQVDTIKARLDGIPDLLKRFRQSVLASAVSGKLTEEWRGDAEKAWKKGIKLDSLCESSFYGPRFSKDDYSDVGIPTIRTTDMTANGGINVTPDTPRIVVPDEKVEQFKVNKGDLLVTRTGSVGVMAIFTGDYLAIPSAYLIRFRFNPSVLVEYVYMFLTSPVGQEIMGLSVTTTTQPNINAKSIRNIEIDLPSIKEQKEIVRLVDQYFAFADTIEAQVKKAQAKVDNLTQSILAKAFRGELVPQDPNDEPADKLLERIAEARKEAEALAKAAKKAENAKKRAAKKAAENN